MFLPDNSREPFLAKAYDDRVRKVTRLGHDLSDIVSILLENDEKKIKELFVKKLVTQDINSVIKIMEMKSSEIDFTKEINENIKYLRLMTNKLFTWEGKRPNKLDQPHFDIGKIYSVRKYFWNFLKIDEKIKEKFSSLIEIKTNPNIIGAKKIKEIFSDMNFEPEIRSGLRYFLNKLNISGKAGTSGLDYIILFINNIWINSTWGRIDFSNEIEEFSLIIKRIIYSQVWKIEIDDFIKIIYFFVEYIDLSEEIKAQMLFFIKKSTQKMKIFYEFLEKNPKTKWIDFSSQITN